MKLSIEQFIDELRNSDFYIQFLFTQGSCYKLFNLLNKMFDDCTPYINLDITHVVTKHNDNLYDIYGKVDNMDDYKPMTEDDIKLSETWEFRKNWMLKIAECPYCDEPMVFDEMN